MTKALIIGNGAVGIALGAELARLGLEPRFVGRAGPVRVRASFERDRVEELDFPAPTTSDVETAALAFVAVRAFDLEAALDHTGKLGRGIPVVPVSNGATWELVRAAAKKRPDLSWRLGFATFGISVLGERRYAVRSKTGELSFGPLHQGEAPLAIEQRLVEAKSLFHWHAGIEKLVRRKWLYNTVINSLCAARRLERNGDLLRDLSLLSSVFTEALQLQDELWGALPMSRDELFNGLRSLIEQTEANENSMARDVRLGRRTESAFLAGLARNPHKYPMLTELNRAIEGAGA